MTFTPITVYLAYDDVLDGMPAGTPVKLIGWKTYFNIPSMVIEIPSGKQYFVLSGELVAELIIVG
jgi:hypothetical protein